MLQKATVFCILLLLIVLYGCNENKDLNKISTQEQLVKIIEREKSIKLTALGKLLKGKFIKEN